MKSFVEIEQQIEEGDILTLDQVNDENSYGVVFVASVIRNQENIDVYLLGEEMMKQLGSMFPRIKYYMGYSACYFQVKYNPESKQFVSAIMTKNFFEKDSILKGLNGNADNLMDSMLKLEEKIATMMQSSSLLRRIKI